LTLKQDYIILADLGEQTMKIDCLVLGLYETNCYILHSGADDSVCTVIDPGQGGFELIDYLGKNDLTPVDVILTHGHADHIAGVEQLREHFPRIKVYIHKLDGAMLTGEQDNLSELTGLVFKIQSADVLLSEGDSILMRLGLKDIKLEVIHTPGHTPGGMCLYAKEQNVLFSGDTLFAGSVGRTDFPGGNIMGLISGIKSKLLTLPDETRVYPGHGPITTIGSEKTGNPFIS